MPKLSQRDFEVLRTERNNKYNEDFYYAKERLHYTRKQAYAYADSKLKIRAGTSKKVYKPTKRGYSMMGEFGNPTRALKNMGFRL